MWAFIQSDSVWLMWDPNWLIKNGLSFEEVHPNKIKRKLKQILLKSNYYNCAFDKAYCN